MDLLSTIETRIEKLEKKISKKTVKNRLNDEKLQKAIQGLNDDSKLMVDLIQKQKSLDIKVIFNLLWSYFYYSFQKLEILLLGFKENGKIPSNDDIKPKEIRVMMLVLCLIGTFYFSFQSVLDNL